MGKTQDTYLSTDPWKIVEEEFHPEKSRVSESLFSLANEYQGVRGYFEEGYSGDTLPGCYLNGVWEEHHLQEPPGYRGIPDRIRFMVNTVDWLHVRLELDGEVLDLARSRFSEFRRELDFSSGILRRELVWHTQSGKALHIAFTRLLSMRQKELGVQRISLTPLSFSGPVSVTLGLDFSLPHECYGESFWDTPRKCAEEGSCSILGVSRNVRQKLFTGFNAWASSPMSLPQPLEASRFVGRRFRLDLRKGREESVERVAVLFTTGDPMASEEQVWSRGSCLLEEVGPAVYRRVLLENLQHWKEVWDSSDIVIDGDAPSQQGIRFCIFQLHQTCRGVMDASTVGAKGLTGEAYNGHTFWDTETYCLPYYIFNNPRAARALLDFRHRTLSQALERARELDCAGACFPVATIDGTESCTLWQHASLQFQPSTAVAYAVMHYVNVTGDTGFLYGKGAELLVHICRFLASRGQWSQRGRGFGYYGVMGPDEFHMMVNNDYYTNYMARQTFVSMLRVIAEMQGTCPERVTELFRRSSCTGDERDSWRSMAEAMILPIDPRTGVHEQHDGFFDLPHIEVERIRAEEFPLYAHWSYDRIFRTDMIKQPDVLMAMFLYNQSFTAAEKRANYEYYAPRCIHESSLSPSVHSILATELGRQVDALSFFRFATRIDLDNYNRNTSEGLHMTSIAAAWMNIVYGFGGLRSDGRLLAMAPTIPEGWICYRFSLLYRGSVISVEVDHSSARIQVMDGPDVTAVIGGQPRHVTRDGVRIEMGDACNNG